MVFIRNLVKFHRFWLKKMLLEVLTDYSDVKMTAMASQITGVSVVCSTVCSRVDQRKHQSSASLASVRGIHLWPVDSFHKGPVTRKYFHLMTSSCIRLLQSSPLKTSWHENLFCITGLLWGESTGAIILSMSSNDKTSYCQSESTN